MTSGTGSRSRLTRSTGAGSEPRGFTLVEILVSVVILSLGTVAILQALGRSATALASAEYRRQAVLFCASKMAEADLTLRTGRELEEHSGGKVRLGGQSFVWNLSSVADESIPRLKTVSLIVEWTEGAQTLQERVETVFRRAKRPDEKDA